VADPDVYTLPDDLPVPEDDGACDHLSGRSLPALQLPATAGERIDLSAIPRSSWRRGLELPTFTVAGVTLYKRASAWSCGKE
jgi:hypothetical protein